MGRTKRNQELKKKSNAELEKELGERREELETVRFDVAGTQAKDTKHISEIKKDYARILTEMNARNRSTT